MIYWYQALCAILFVSNILILLYFSRKNSSIRFESKKQLDSYQKKLEEAEKKPALTKDASDLLTDLVRGGAVAVVKVIDPSAMFLWSPRDKE
jgi:hypothetical protein